MYIAVGNKYLLIYSFTQVNTVQKSSILDQTATGTISDNKEHEYSALFLGGISIF